MWRDDATGQTWLCLDPEKNRPGSGGEETLQIRPTLRRVTPEVEVAVDETAVEMVKLEIIPSVTSPSGALPN